MTADTLKTTRVLELYQDFLSGKLINKQEAAEQYYVNVRSIQRDIDSIRDFLSEQCAKEGIVRKIEYDKKENGYRLVTQEVEQLSKGEVLALCKILLESRAFTKEQVEKQLQIILNLCVSQKEKADIEWFISNELFHYHDPAHAAVDPDNLWMVAQAIRNQSVMEIEYQKLKDHQIVKRTVEPVGLMFSEYYFYLMGIITDSSTREAFHKKNDPYPTIYRLDRIHSVRETGEKFSVPYKDRFKEGEYKNRTQFMFGGEPQTVHFNYYGPSVEAVLDKFPIHLYWNFKEAVKMYYEQLFQTNEAKMNFVKGLIRISKADGGISPEEQTFFIDAARGLGISEEDIAMLPAVMNQDAEIPLAFASRSEVLCFLREALQLCMVDDEYSDAERKEIMELAQAFSIEPERVHALETWVQEGIEWKARGDKLLED